MIFLDSAGASLQPDVVLNAIQDHLKLESQHGGYAAYDMREGEFEEIYSDIATLINAKSTEIALVEHATRAWLAAFWAILFKPGDLVLYHSSEYGTSYLNLLHAQRTKGIVLEQVPSNEHGEICLSALERLLDKKPVLLSLTHAPSSNGLVNPVKEVGDLLRGSDCIYLLDTCQSCGQIPIDVEEIGCDVICATGRKYLRGPRGTGFLYVRNECLESLEPSQIDLGSTVLGKGGTFEWLEGARRFETWEKNIAAFFGLKAAIRFYKEQDPHVCWDKISSLSTKLRSGLGEMNQVEVHDTGRFHSGIVTFSIKDKSTAEVLESLNARDVVMGVQSFRATPVDHEERKIDSLCRVSVHYFNTEEEIDNFLSFVSEL